MTTHELHNWAIAQGANHYLRETANPNVYLSINEGICCLLEEGSSHSLRLAGCLLFHSEAEISSVLKHLSQSAKQRLGHILACGLRVDSDNSLWHQLKEFLEPSLLNDGPHWSRFCTHGKGGFSYMGQEFIWLKPNPKGHKHLKQLPAYSAWQVTC